MIAAALAACLVLLGTQAAPYEKTTPGPPTSEAKERLQVQVAATEITLTQGDRTVLHYRYTDVPFKPYVRALYSPNGLNVVLDAPPDHLHHHGLMFAVAVNDVHFWAEDAHAGKQMHTNKSVDVRDDLAAFSALLPWHIDSKVLVREYRRITLLRTPPDLGANLITWWSSLTPDTEATLTGHHYYGLGMRFAAGMDRAGTFINTAGAEGEVFRGDERLTQANWCAYTAEHGKTVDLYYGVAVWDGRVDSDRIEQVYRYWLQNTQIAQPSRSDEQ